MKRGSLFTSLVVVALVAGLVATRTVGSASLVQDRLADSTVKTAPVAVPRRSETSTSSVAATESATMNGDGVGRAVSAPFRALAKLFGGKKKSEEAKRREAEEKKKAEERKAAERAARAEAEAARKQAEKERAQAKKERKQEEKQSKQKKQTAQASPQDGVPVEAAEAPRPASKVAAVMPPAVSSVAPSAAPPAAASIVLPAAPSIVPPVAPPVVQPSPSTWTPVIGGVPLDPLSQGRALLQHGYVNEAIAELSVAATVGPDLVEANTLLGVAYDHMGMRAQAQEYYERALSVAPYNAEALYNLGHSLYLGGQYKEAMKRLKTAARVSPNDPRIPFSAALVEIRLGKYEDAFRSLVLISDPYSARFNLAAILEDSNLSKEAIKQYEAALRLRPNAPVVLERLADLYQRTGHRREAEAIRRTLPKPATKTTTGGG